MTHPNHYSKPTKRLHWLSAFIIITVIILGIAITKNQLPEVKYTLLRWHAPLGMIAALLILARIFFAFTHKRPKPDPDWSPFIVFSSKFIHFMLYFTPLLLTTSGIGMLIISGAASNLISHNTGPWPDLTLIPPRQSTQPFCKIIAH